MSFDLATARPVDPQRRGGFDLSTARPVGASDESLSDQIPGERRKIAPEQPTDWMDKARGAVETAGSVVAGLPAAGLGYAGGALGGVAGSVASGEFGTPEGARKASESASEGAAKLSKPFQPSSPSGQRQLDSFGRMVESTKVPPWPITGGIPGVGPALTAAETGVGRMAAKVPGALKAIPGKLADLVTPMPAAEIQALAKKAESMGIELRPDMLSNNRIAKMIGQALEQVPLSGSKAEQRQMAFNSALSKIIGSDEKVQRLTPDVFDRAMTKSGKKIGEISEETPIKLDAELRQKFIDRVTESEKFETEDVAKIVKNYSDELQSKAGQDGIIPGETFRKINSRIGAQIRSTSNGDLKHALYELQEDMHDALEKNIASPERLAELKDARLRYAMGKIIEPLVAKAKGGDISPAGLMGAVTSSGSKKTMMARGRAGEIGDLARIGQAFLKEPPSSGTGERLGAYSILTGGVVTQPHTAAGIVGAANLYNRLGPKLTKRAINKRAEPFSDMIESTAAPAAPSLPEVPGAAPTIPGTNFSTMLRSTAEPKTPLPQLPPSIRSLEEQLGASEPKGGNAELPVVAGDTKEMRESIVAMRSQIGQAETGGKLIARNDVDGIGGGGMEVLGKTPWVADPWWNNRPDYPTNSLSAAEALKAINKYAAGEKLGKREERFITYTRYYIEDQEAAGQDFIGASQSEKLDAIDAIEFPEGAPPIKLDNWSELSEAQKNEQLDEIFGTGTGSTPEGEKGR